MGSMVYLATKKYNRKSVGVGLTTGNNVQKKQNQVQVKRKSSFYHIVVKEDISKFIRPTSLTAQKAHGGTATIVIRAALSLMG